VGSVTSVITAGDWKAAYLSAPRDAPTSSISAPRRFRASGLDAAASILDVAASTSDASASILNE